MRRALSLLAVLCFTGLAHAADPEPPHVAAARKRQEAVKSLDITFEQTETVNPGADSYLRFPNKPPTLKFPTDKLILKSVNRLVIDGTRIRFEDRHPNRTSLHVLPRDWLYIFDDRRMVQFFPQGVSGLLPNAECSIGDRLSLPLYSKLWVPLTTTFRGLDGQLNGHSVDRLTDKATLDVFETDKRFTLLKKFQGRQQFWVRFVHEQDFVVTRFESESDDGIRVDVRAEYRKHDIFGWVPDWWDYADYYHDGSPLTTTRIKVLDLKINEAVSPEEFELTLPPGTRVSDSTKEPHREYVIQDDGSELDLTPTPPPTHEEPLPSFWPYLAGGLLIGCGGLAVVLLTMGKRRRAHGDSSLGHDSPP